MGRNSSQTLLLATSPKPLCQSTRLRTATSARSRSSRSQRLISTGWPNFTVNPASKSTLKVNESTEETLTNHQQLPKFKFDENSIKFQTVPTLSITVLFLTNVTGSTVTT